MQLLILMSTEDKHFVLVGGGGRGREKREGGEGGKGGREGM